MQKLSENHILACIQKHFPAQHPSLLLGRGDDCAVIRTNNCLSVSTDLFVENVHFRTRYFTPEEVGHKALAVNISDMAAMGVRPLGFSLGLGLPPTVDMAWLEGFFSGMAALAKSYDIPLSGGDISKSDSIHICITIWGEGQSLLPRAAQGEGASSSDKAPLGHYGCNFLARGGAMVGDVLFLIGPVGLARIGLEELEKHGEAARVFWPEACKAHLMPSPQVDAGLILARSFSHLRPPVLMDVSDGLVRDLPRLLGPKDDQGKYLLGAQLEITESMLQPEVLRHAQEKDRSAVHEAWLGGEDYALLGACVPKLLPILHAAIPSLQHIGHLTDEGDIMLNGERMEEEAGFDHFVKPSLKKEPAIIMRTPPLVMRKSSKKKTNA